MEVDLAEIINGTISWDFKIKLGTESIPVPSPTLQSIVRVLAAGKAGENSGLADAVRDAFRDSPSLAVFPVEVLSAIWLAMFRFWRDQVGGKTLAIAVEVATAMAKGATATHLQ